jgi:hypothetical protein
MLREATYPPAAVNVLDVSSESMAAFQVFMYGRFWVFTEAAFAACLADNFAKSKIVLKVSLDPRDVRTTVSGRFQLVGNVGVGADKRCGRFVERVGRGWCSDRSFARLSQ